MKSEFALAFNEIIERFNLPAETVMEALEQIGVQGVTQVATGTVYHLHTKGAQLEETIRTLCERILANPVIQHYEVFDADGKQLVKG